MGKPIEDERHAFQLKAVRQLGDTFFQVFKQWCNVYVHHDPTEIIGEVPADEVPGQVVFDKSEIDPPSQRLEALRRTVRANSKRIVIGTAVGTGVIIATIGTIMAVKHFVDKNPHSDITDK